MPSDRFNLSGFIHANSAILQKNAFKISSESLSCCACKEKGLSSELHKEGLQLLTKSKAAIVVILNDEVNIGKDLETEASHICIPETKLLHFQELILDYKGLLEVAGQGISVPLILVVPAHEIRSYEELVSNSDFDLDNQKVWFLEEEKLPIVSLSSDSPKILTKSSCEILEAPTGSGGVFSLLSSYSVTDKLIEMGVEFVQICCLGGRSKSATSESLLLFGLVKSRGADMGIRMLQGEIKENDEFNIVFSMMHLNKICKQIDKLEFSPLPEQHAHVEVVKVEEDYAEQIHPIPDKPNSFHLHSSIYSALKTCSLDRICIMCVTSDK